MIPRPATVLIGPGRLGRSLAGALHAAGWPVLGVFGRDDVLGVPTAALAKALDQADLVIFTVPDRAIAPLAPRLLAPHHLALHMSGATPSAALREHAAPKAVAACHPLQSFGAETSPPEHFRGVAFALEGEPLALGVARELVSALGGWHFELDLETAPDGKRLYHAGCALASNGLVALVHRAVQLFGAAGVPESVATAALGSLVLGTARNLTTASSPADVLTGPVARGDTAVVDGHRDAIDMAAPEVRGIYDAVTAELEDLVRHRWAR